MTRNLHTLRHRISASCSGALPLFLLLSACGGGGDGSFVASTPPPPVTPLPTPTPTQTPTVDVKTSWIDSPATRNGTYDLIGRLTLTPGNGDATSYRQLSPGQFTLSASQPAPTSGFNYMLGAPPGTLPAGLTSIQTGGPLISWDFNLPPSPSYHYDNPWGDFTQYLGQHLTASSKAADGSETQFLSYDLTRGSTSTLQSLGPTTNLRTTLNYDIGYSYVAMGEWSWRVVDLNGTAAGDFGDLLFVNGDRTPAAGIPASGTATYDARTLALLSSGGTLGIPFTLTADFGQRTIATRIDQNYQYNVQHNAGDISGNAALGIHVSGVAPFSNSGTFDIPLSGSANYSAVNSPVTPPSEAVTGIMNGAFFGPHAEQVGGVFSLERSGGVLLMQDAFVGQQHH
jgi:hypothetical protein